ncbi:MAG: hypothetical protein ACYC9Y_01680 [Candidatus Methylomirabilia bacterium]
MIAYFNKDVPRLEVASCGNITCTSGNVIEEIEAFNPGPESSLALTIGSDGLPVVAYYNAYSRVLRVAKLISRPLGRR